MRKIKQAGIRRGGKNVFADLGLPGAESHFVKAQLVARMMEIMKARKLSQTAVAVITGISRPDVSNLIRGRLRGYSIDRLVGFLVALDQEVEIIVKSKQESHAHARLTVRAA